MMKTLLLFTYAALLLLNQILCISETHSSPEQTTSWNDVRNSGREKQETQQFCEESSCSSVDKDSGMALMVYSEESIPLHYKPQRQFTFLGHTLTISQSWGKHGVAGVVWDSAVVLCEYLATQPGMVRGKRVLELGSGTGLVGMVAALAGGHVTLTERAEPLEILEATVTSNLDPGHHHFQVSELDWTHDHTNQVTSAYDVILGADIIYIEDTFPDLLRTLLHFMGPETHVLLSCKIRYEKDSRFLSMLQEHAHVSKVHFDAHRDIHIYSVKRSSSVGFS